MSDIHKSQDKSTIELPQSLLDEVQPAIDKTGGSVSAFAAEAIAEKLEALRQLAYFESRIARSKPGQARDLLARAGRDGPVQAGDEIP